MPRPWNKINISKEVLEGLYENQSLSIAQIATKLGYSTRPIHRLLREYQIKIRSISEAKEKFKISKQKLKNLYLKQELSTEQIAKKYGCSHATIVNRMKKYGIKSRGHLGLTRPIRTSKEKLEYLYHTRGLSLAKIAKILHCSEGGIERKMKNLGIKTRSISNRACKHKKKDFNGSLIEKAYMIGFRLGDLNVSQKKNVIVLRCSTTKRAQASLIKNLFSPYGGVSITKAKRGTIEINVYLNNSFKFLLPKEDRIPSWIIKNKKFFLAFFAGYADAEGSIMSNKLSRGNKTASSTIEIQSYDKTILYQGWSKLKSIGVACPGPRISKPAGYVGKNGIKHNGDCWRLSINKKTSLWKLLHFMEPYIRHRQKKKALEGVKKNIILRNQLSYCRKIDLSIPKIS